MNRRWQLNILLFVVVAVLVVVAILQPGIEKPEPKPRLSTIQDSEIKHASIERLKAPTIVLERKNSDVWRMIQPRTGRTNPFIISSLLRVIRAASEQELPVEAGKDLGEFGLDTPKATVRLDGNIVRFGDINPVNNQQYVLFNGRIHMIDHRYFWAVSRPVTEFLSKQLIESGRKPTMLQLPHQRLELVKGSWRVKPERKDLSADRIKQLVDDWVHAQALMVKNYERGAISDWVSIIFKPLGPNTKPTTLRVGIVARTPELILYRPDEGLQYHFPKDLEKRLLSFGK
jgi:hypothetical protein